MPSRPPITLPDNFAARAQRIITTADGLFRRAANEHALDTAKAEVLGVTLKPLLKNISTLSAAARPAAGQQLNAVRTKVLQLYAAARLRLRAQTIAQLLRAHVDVSLPGRTASVGSCHPISRANERAVNILTRVGFEIADGPEIETDYYNFTALNHPPNHPARSMHDTFYTSDQRLLRTHTSPVQIRHMLAGAGPPLQAIAPGRVYRRDHDSTHSPMFHQIEGIWIDEHISFAQLKAVLTGFFRAFFDDSGIEIRFRPSFFRLLSLQLNVIF